MPKTDEDHFGSVQDIIKNQLNSIRDDASADELLNLFYEEIQLPRGKNIKRNLYLQKIIQHPNFNPNLKFTDGDKKGETLLTLATQSTDDIHLQLYLLKELLSITHIDPNAENAHGYPPLYYAVKQNKIYLAEELLKSPNIITHQQKQLRKVSLRYNRQTLIDVAASSYKNNEEMIKLLQQHGIKRSKKIKLPTPQGHLIRNGRALGYKLSKDGVCYGTSHTVLQIIQIAERNPSTNALIELKKLKERLGFLEKVRPESLAKLIENAKTKRMDLIKDFKKNIGPMLISDGNTNKEFLANQRENFINEHLTPEDKMLIEMPAFFESIMVIQQQEQFKKLINKKDLTDEERKELKELQQFLQLVAPQKLEKPLAFLDRFVGAYTAGDLENMLDGLREQFKGFSHPISFELSNILHSISISYDPILDVFILSDANRVPIDVKSNTDVIAEFILDAFSHKSDDPFCLCCFRPMIAAPYKEEAQERLNAWRQSEAWQSANKITADKINYKTKKDITLEQIARRHDDYRVLSQIKKPSNIFTRNKKGWLYIAGIIAVTVVAIAIFATVSAATFGVGGVVGAAVGIVAAGALYSAIVARSIRATEKENAREQKGIEEYQRKEAEKEIPIQQQTIKKQQTTDNVVRQAMSIIPAKIISPLPKPANDPVIAKPKTLSEIISIPYLTHKDNKQARMEFYEGLIYENEPIDEIKKILQEKQSSTDLYRLVESFSKIHPKNFEDADSERIAALKSMILPLAHNKLIAELRNVPKDDWIFKIAQYQPNQLEQFKDFVNLAANPIKNYLIGIVDNALLLSSNMTTDAIAEKLYATRTSESLYQLAEDFWKIDSVKCPPNLRHRHFALQNMLPDLAHDKLIAELKLIPPTQWQDKLAQYHPDKLNNLKTHIVSSKDRIKDQLVSTIENTLQYLDLAEKLR